MKLSQENWVVQCCTAEDLCTWDITEGTCVKRSDYTEFYDDTEYICWCDNGTDDLKTKGQYLSIYVYLNFEIGNWDLIAMVSHAY